MSIPFPPPDISKADALEQERKTMTAYSETAKTYGQLSLGALVLSVTFIEKVAASSVNEEASLWLYAAWCLWLISALAGATYQYLAVRFVEARGEAWGLLSRSGHYQAFNRLANHPWPVYGCMLLAFAFGSVCFVAFGVGQLSHASSRATPTCSRSMSIRAGAANPAPDPSIRGRATAGFASIRPPLMFIAPQADYCCRSTSDAWQHRSDRHSR